MKFTDYIAKRNIIAIEATNKADAIGELAARLKKSRLISDTKKVVIEVLERESLETTGIGRGVAIPHARCSAAKKLVCAVGLCKKPIDFRAFDGKPARMVFLIVYPNEDTQKYLYFISLLARVFSESKYRKDTLRAETPRDVHEALRNCDRALAETDAKTVEAAQVTRDGKVALENKQVDLVLLIRLQRLNMIAASRKRPPKELLDQIEQLRSCVEPQVLTHFDRLTARPGGVAVVAVEGDVCQGCHMKLPSRFVQELRDGDRVYTCPTCGRFVYDVIGM